MKSPHNCTLNPSILAASLARWFETPVGEATAQALRHRLDRVVGEFFGYYALETGWYIHGLDLLGSSRIKHRIRLQAAEGDVDVVADPAALPIETDSVDLVLLVFGLEFARDPHRVLREADRILIPEGHLVIVGFNPISALGLWKLVLGSRGQVPWCGRFYTSARIRDWLALLGLKTLAVDSFAYRPPVQRPRVYQWLSPLERIGAWSLPPLGGVQLVLAKKQVAAVTPIRPRWRPRRSLIPGNLAEPTARERAHG